jgi:hypothetical protein
VRPAWRGAWLPWRVAAARAPPLGDHDARTPLCRPCVTPPNTACTLSWDAWAVVLACGRNPGLYSPHTRGPSPRRAAPLSARRCRRLRPVPHRCSEGRVRVGFEACGRVQQRRTDSPPNCTRCGCGGRCGRGWSDPHLGLSGASWGAAPAARAGSPQHARGTCSRTPRVHVPRAVAVAVRQTESREQPDGVCERESSAEQVKHTRR